MRSLLVLFLAFSAPIAVLSSQSVLINGVSDNSLDVPGENTLTYCKDPSDYVFNIDHIDLSPNPPETGKNLTVTASGTSSETIDKGAKLFIQVKLGYITLIKKEYEFCDVVGAVDLACPLEKGYREIVKVVEIPGAVPPGKYVVTANAYTENHEKEITCLEGSIVL